MAKRKLTFLCVCDQKTGKAIVLLGGCCPQVTVEQTQHSSSGSPEPCRWRGERGTVGWRSMGTLQRREGAALKRRPVCEWKRSHWLDGEVCLELRLVFTGCFVHLMHQEVQCWRSGRGRGLGRTWWSRSLTGEEITTPPFFVDIFTQKTTQSPFITWHCCVTVCVSAAKHVLFPFSSSNVDFSTHWKPHHG